MEEGERVGVICFGGEPGSGTQREIDERKACEETGCGGEKRRSLFIAIQFGGRKSGISLGEVYLTDGSRTGVQVSEGRFITRPIYHQKEERIEAHIFIAFQSYCLFVTLKQRLKALAPGLTPKAVLDKLGEIQMIDVHLPTADGREIKLSRYTQPTRDHQMLLNQMKLDLPSQPPPRISGKGQVVH